MNVELSLQYHKPVKLQECCAVRYLTSELQHLRQLFILHVAGKNRLTCPETPPTTQPPQPSETPPTCADCNHICPVSSSPSTDLPNSTSTTLVSPGSTVPNTTMEASASADGSMMETCPSLAALGGGLGGLCAILAILLVGVVMGWVWTSHSKTRKSELQER